MVKRLDNGGDRMWKWSNVLRVQRDTHSMNRNERVQKRKKEKSKKDKSRFILCGIWLVKRIERYACTLYIARSALSIFYSTLNWPFGDSTHPLAGISITFRPFHSPHLPLRKRDQPTIACRSTEQTIRITIFKYFCPAQNDVFPIYMQFLVQSVSRLAKRWSNERKWFTQDEKRSKREQTRIKS